MRMFKKGQTEDYFSDFLIALIFLVFGLIFLNMAFKSPLSESLDEVVMLQEGIDLFSYIKSEVIVDNSYVSVADLINLVYNNPDKYGTTLQEASSKFLKGEKYFVCSIIKISLPGKEDIVFHHAECNQKLDEKSVLVPLDDYKFANVTIGKGQIEGVDLGA